MPRICSSLAVVIVASLLPSFLQAENWPAWRGPHGDGITTETNLPLTWSATENVKWKTPLAGPGNSTPIVWNDRVFLTQAEGQKRVVICFDRKTGKTLWQEGTTWTEPEPTHQANPPCAASPVTDGERVIAWFGSAGLWCFDFAGKPLWHIDLGKQEHIWGFASSPVIDGDLCILNFGPGDRSFLVAVDKKTGKEAWRHDVPPPAVNEGNGSTQGYKGSWATPVIAKLDGRAQLVVPWPGAVYGIDPKNGSEIWHCNGLNPLAYANAMVAGDIVVAMGGYGGFAIGVEPKGQGDLTASRLWQEKRNAQRIGSGVVKDGYLYMPNDPGVIQCIDPKAGRVVWQQRMKTNASNASTWSSFVLSGDRLYLVTKSTDTVVVKASPEKFEQLATNSVGDKMSNSSVAVSNGELFIRTYQNLWCIGGGK